MKQTRTVPEHVTRAVVEFLATTEAGADLKACCKAVGLSDHTLRKYLHLMPEVECSQASKNTRWCLPHQMAKVREFQTRKKMEYFARHLKKPRIYGDIELPESAQEWKPRQLWVDANKASPLPKLGPATVWELAL